MSSLLSSQLSRLNQLLVRSVLALFVALGCTIAIAQPPQGGRGSRSKGGMNREMMEALYEAMQNACEKEILDMLRFTPVLEEIQLSDELQEDLQAMRIEAGKDLIEIFRDQKPDLKKQIESLFKELSSNAFKKIEETAGERAVDRLYGLFMQHRRAESIRNRLVAKRVGLSDEELKAFRKRVDAERKKSEAAVEKIMGMPNLEFKEKRKRLEEQMRSMREAANEKLLQSLSQEHRDKFEELQGPPFDKLPRRWQSSGRGGGRSKERTDSGRPNSDSGSTRVERKEDSGENESKCCLVPFYYSDAFLSL
ncbi:MAG: hypothetical protein VXZ82_09235 [Planctomycetota bacterium]|nr:hypothetical protein [Planctomycetota bacterium]